jgi:hypothetical protein
MLRGALPMLFITPLFALSFLPRIASVPNLQASFWAASGLLALWYLLVVVRARAEGWTLDFDFQAIKSHYVQAMVQGSVYVYWATAWPWVIGQAPLILAQILFAYACTMLLSWSRGRKWQLGFGPIPIMLSSNFFLCFKDDWFYLQFAMIAVGMLGKEFIRWQRDGRSTHIFNPSAFGLFIFSIALIATGKTDISWAEEIAINLGQPEHMFVFIFAVGLIVQYFFHVTLVTLCAAAALYVLNVLYFQATGIYWFVDAGIPIAVFLGLHLLVTDPATSPRTNLGRILFGIGYGASVFALYALLEWAGEPRFYDKLLCVPVLNLTVQVLDRIGRQSPLTRVGLFARIGRLDPRRQNLVHMGLWITLFAWMYATNFVGKDHPGRTMEFWSQACAEQRHNACRNVVSIEQNDCGAGDVSACMRVGSAVVERSLPSEDPLFALRSFSQACELGQSYGCARLSQLLNAESIGRLEAACSEGDAQACYILGSVNLMSLAGTQDHPAAIRFFGRSCDLGHAAACNVLGDAHKFGVGTTRDRLRAAEAYEQGCARASPVGCASLADLLSSGDGVDRDTSRAKALYLKACRLGMAAACKR